MVTTDHYLDFVSKKADEVFDKIFILDSGEGRDFTDPVTGWNIEDLSGWIIEKAKKESFMQSRKQGSVNEDFADDYVFVKWYKSSDDILRVEFKKF
jgi:hypothetical protein